MAVEFQASKTRENLMRAFAGESHYLHARMARREEIAARKNLALNPWAAHRFDGAFPFASANVETRGEAVFAARNAIDGYKANDSHGGWPYTSWGINRDPKAALRVDFGRLVELDEAVLYLRADFPHDAWWKEGTLHFSDGSQVMVKLEKTAAGQSFSFPPRKVEWVVLDSLVKADDPSPFPALTQLELCESVEAPVEPGQKLGELKVLVDGQQVDAIGLIAADGVERLSIGGIFKRFLNALFLQNT